MDGQPLDSRDLLNTILTHRLPHHFPLGAGHVSEGLSEFCAWLGISVLPPVPHRRNTKAPVIIA